MFMYANKKGKPNQCLISKNLKHPNSVQVAYSPSNGVSPCSVGRVLNFFPGLSMHRNWLKLWRKTEDSAVFKDTNAWHVFCYLLLKAQWKKDKYSCSFEGEQIYLQRGEVVIGRYLMAKALQMPPSTVRNSLTRLFQKYRIISLKTDNKRTIVTLLNWDTYQNEESKQDNERTTRGQQLDTNQEGKEVKNEKIVCDKKTSHSLTGYFKDSFKNKCGGNYVATAKDGATLKRLLGTHTQETLEECVDSFFNSDDKWIEEAGYTIGVFSSQINKLIQGEVITYGRQQKTWG